MRNDHHGKNNKLVKRAFALCLALAVICSCLLPVFATEGGWIATQELDASTQVATMDTAFGVDDGYGIATQETDAAASTSQSGAVAAQPGVSTGSGAVVAGPVVDGSTSDSTSSGSTSESTASSTTGTSEAITDPSTITDADIPEGATDIVRNSNGSYSYTMPYGRVTVKPTQPGEKTTWTGEETVVTRDDDRLKEDDAAFGVLPIEYHFWLKQLDSEDFRQLDWEAQMAEMSETEYLALFGASDQFPIWHMDTISSVDTISNYKFANPTSKDDPENKGRVFDYWYTVDSTGLKHKFDPYKTYGSESDTIVNVYAAWREADGTESKDESASTTTTKKTVTATTSDGVTVTVKGLPETAKSLSVEPMSDSEMDSFYKLYRTQKNGTAAPIVGFNIEPLDATGNVVQPKGPVTVTISGLSSELAIYPAPYKMLHQVTASDVQTINVSYDENSDTLTFATNSFSPFVVASKDGYETSTLLDNQNLTVGQTTTIEGTKSNYPYGGYQHYWSVDSTSKGGEVSLTNTHSQTVTVTAKKAGTVRLLHYYYKRGWQSEYVTITIEGSKDSASFQPHITNAIVGYIHYTQSQGDDKTYMESATLTVLNANGVKDIEYDTIFNTEYDSSTNNFWVFFVKPYNNYLITGIGADGAHDIYDATAASYGNINWYPGIHDLKHDGYVGVFGYYRAANSTIDEIEFTVNAKTPDMVVTAVSDKTENVQEGEKLTFTVTIEPGTVGADAGTGTQYKHGAEPTGVTIEHLKINGKDVEYTTPQKDANGHWVTTVKYTATAEDCAKGKVELTVDAAVDYKVVMGVSKVDGKDQQIVTNAKVEKTATAECLIAPKQAVRYVPLFKEGTPTPPDELKALNNKDEFMYTPGAWVTVQSDPLGNGKTYSDSINGGVWTFNGWYLDEDLTKPTGGTVKMTEDGLIFYGEWTFEKTYTKLTVSKNVTGLMGDTKKPFEFKIVAQNGQELKLTLTDITSQTGDVTFDDQNNTFTLTHGSSITLNLPVGSYVIEETAVDNYTTTYKIGDNKAEDGIRAEVTLGDTDQTVAFTNHCDLEPDLGVLLDTLPYIVILAVVAGGGVLLMLRKRRKEDD